MISTIPTVANDEHMTNVVNVDSSSDEDVHMELSDYKYSHPFVVKALQLTREMTEDTPNFRRAMSMCMADGSEGGGSLAGEGTSSAVRPSTSRQRVPTSFTTMIKRFQRIQDNAKSSASKTDMNVGASMAITEEALVDQTAVTATPTTSTAVALSVSTELHVTTSESIQMDSVTDNNDNNDNLHSTEELPNISTDSMIDD